MSDPAGNVTGDFYASIGAIGYGAEVQVGLDDGSPETFVSIPEITRVSPLVSMTTPPGDVTHLRSPDRHREKVPLLSDSGPIVCEGTYRPSHGAHLLAGGDGFDADHNLQALRASAARNNFRILLPEAFGTEGSPASAIAIPIVGYVSKYEVGELSLENKVPFTLEITPTSAYYSR